MIMVFIRSQSESDDDRDHDLTSQLLEGSQLHLGSQPMIVSSDAVQEGVCTFSH